MKAKTKFMKMYYKLPKDARTELVYNPYGQNPMTLAVCKAEIEHNTNIGKAALLVLGYEDS